MSTMVFNFQRNAKNTTMAVQKHKKFTLIGCFTVMFVCLIINEIHD